MWFAGEEMFKKVDKKIINILIISTIFLIGLFFYVFALNSEARRAELRAHNSLKFRVTYINETIADELESIKRGTTNLEFFDYNNRDTTYLKDITELDLIEFGQMNHIVKDFNNTNLKIIYRYGSRIYYQDFRSHHLVLKRQDHLNFLINNDGKIIESFTTNNDDYYSYNIQDILGMTMNELKKINRSELINYDSKNYLAFERLENTDYYFVQLSPKEYYAYEIEASRYLLLFLMAVVILGTIYMLTVFFTDKAKTKNVKDLNVVLLSKYNNFFTATVDSKGNFTYYNDLFKDLFITNKQTNIYQFKLTGKGLNTKENFLLSLDNNDYLFNYQNYGKDYILVGEIYTNLLQKQQEEIYINKITQLPNLKSFEEHLEIAKTIDNLFFIIIDLNDYSQILLRFGEEKANSILMYITDYLKFMTIEDNKQVFHTSEDNFLLSF